MSRNKITIDLRRTPLTPDQTKDLHNALHNTLVTQLKKAAATSPAGQSSGKAPSKAALKAMALAATGPQTATLTVTITNTEPGDSSITATCNGTSKTITKGGKIAFENVKSGDLIAITGDSLGKTTITVDLSADPTSMSFPQGHIDGQFFIN